MTDWTIIRRSMTSRRFSTVTTIITVAVAVGLMLTLLSMRDSGRKAFERGTGNMHLLVSNDSSPLVSVLDGIFYADPPARPILWSKYNELLATYPHEYAIPTQQGDSYLGLPVMATTPEFFTKFSPDANYDPSKSPDTQSASPWKLESGRFFNAPFEVVLGARAAREAGVHIGDTIELSHGTKMSSNRGTAAKPHIHSGFPYTIVGILKPTGSSHDRAVFTDLNSTCIIHAHERRLRDDPTITTTTQADLIDADRKITGIYLRLPTREGSNISPLLPTVASKLRADPTLTVAQPNKEIKSLFSIVSSIDQILIAMAAAVMVSSGIAIMLALYNSMEQRRRQIAVLRVLGCSKPRVFGLIVTESAIIGILGALAGLLIALLGTQLVATAMKQRLGLVVEPSFDLKPTAIILFASLTLASIAGVVPALMAYRTPVAKNLRPIG